MDWTVKPRAEANHPPVPNLAHAAEITARRGQRIELDASGSSDLDGHALSYEWFYYHSARRTADAVRRGESPSVARAPGPAEAPDVVVDALRVLLRRELEPFARATRPARVLGEGRPISLLTVLAEKAPAAGVPSPPEARPPWPVDR